MQIMDGFVVVSSDVATRLINELINRSPDEISCEQDFQRMFDGKYFHFRTTPSGFRRYLRGGIPWIAIRDVELGPLIGVVWDGTMFGDTNFSDVSDLSSDCAHQQGEACASWVNLGG